MFKKLSLAALGLILAFSASAEIPSVTLKNLDGKTVDTATISNDGNPIVISFFATWCKPCNRELKAISEVYDEWQEETGMRLIAVSTDEAQNAEKVAALVKAKGWDYEVLLDPNGELKRALGVNDIPHTFIVDGEGNIVWNHQGYVEGGEEDVIEVIRELVK